MSCPQQQKRPEEKLQDLRELCREFSLRELMDEKIEQILDQMETFDGNTCADGVGVGTESASVRAERSGTKKVPGDGRVYHIGFTADDGQGGMCAATVTVCVPHDQRPGHVCVDQGPLFDSTSCP